MKSRRHNWAAKTDQLIITPHVYWLGYGKTSSWRKMVREGRPSCSAAVLDLQFEDLMNSILSCLSSLDENKCNQCLHDFALILSSPLMLRIGYGFRNLQLPNSLYHSSFRLVLIFLQLMNQSSFSILEICIPLFCSSSTLFYPSLLFEFSKNNHTILHICSNGPTWIFSFRKHHHSLFNNQSQHFMNF